MRISDWSSDVCSSGLLDDLGDFRHQRLPRLSRHRPRTFCTGRSEKLKTTASSFGATWRYGTQLGITKVSRLPQSNLCAVSPSPIRVWPVPSTTLNTPEERCGG